ncbi:hypothetical protein XENOCAPTIV_004415, partial [Xenoophorus captivus]
DPGSRYAAFSCDFCNDFPKSTSSWTSPLPPPFFSLSPNGMLRLLLVQLSSVQ